MVFLLLNPSLERIPLRIVRQPMQLDRIRRFVVGLAADAAVLQLLSQQLEQDLSPGQGDIGAFDANIRSGTLGHLRGNEVIGIRKTKSAQVEKNAAGGGRMGSQDSLDYCRYTNPL